MYTISQLFIYPIKSLGGFKVSSAYLTDRGFKYDRRWMLVDANQQFLTQREYPAMSLLQTAILNNELVVYPKDNIADKLVLPLQPSSPHMSKVKIWDDECHAEHVSDAADKWFSSKLSTPCQLVYMPDAEQRKIDGRYAKNQEITSFSDGYPILMIGQASLDDLNQRLQIPLPVDRFRPNIVFTGGRAFDEDTMGHFIINQISLFGVKPCARCVITTIDQEKGLKSKEPLKTLADYRMQGNKIYFGQNVLSNQTGYLKVGDPITVAGSKAAILFDIARQ